MSPMVRVREIPGRGKYSVESQEKENAEGRGECSGVSNGEQGQIDSVRLGAGTANHFGDNELLAGRGCCLFIMAFLAPSAGVGVLYVELIWSQSLSHSN